MNSSSQGTRVTRILNCSCSGAIAASLCRLSHAPLRPSFQLLTVDPKSCGLVSVCDVEKRKTVSSSPPRGKIYGEQSLWDLILCPSWPKTTLGRGDNLRDCIPKWASAGVSGFIQVMEQPGKVAAHCLLWLIKKSLYHRAFESAFNGFSSWFWFLTGCGHLTKKKETPVGRKGHLQPWSTGQVFFSSLLWEADQVAKHTQEASVCRAEAAAFDLVLL